MDTEDSPAASSPEKSDSGGSGDDNDDSPMEEATTSNNEDSAGDGGSEDESDEEEEEESSESESDDDDDEEEVEDDEKEEGDGYSAKVSWVDREGGCFDIIPLTNIFFPIPAKRWNVPLRTSPRRTHRQEQGPFSIARVFRRAQGKDEEDSGQAAALVVTAGGTDPPKSRAGGQGAIQRVCNGGLGCVGAEGETGGRGEGSRCLLHVPEGGGR